MTTELSQRDRVIAFWKDQGFAIWDMGGGCEAFGRAVPNGSFTLVTGDLGTCIPVTLDASVIVGHYDADHECLMDYACLGSIAAADCIAKDAKEPSA